MAYQEFIDYNNFMNIRRLAEIAANQTCGYGIGQPFYGSPNHLQPRIQPVLPSVQQHFHVGGAETTAHAENSSQADMNAHTESAVVSNDQPNQTRNRKSQNWF
jgi:hypothetical protein